MSNLWDIPTAWCWTTMGDATDVIGGGTPSTNNPSNFDGSIPWITPADMSGYSDKTISGGARYISAQGLEDSGARWLPQGTVLFSSRAPIGYVAIASRPVTTNQGFKSFVPGGGLYSDYLYYWLTSAKQHAEALASGTTFLEISGAKAALIPLPLAPTAEQTRIVEKLEELLSDLDAGVAELKAAQKKLGQYRQSLLKAAVEGALTAQWRAQRRAPSPPTPLPQGERGVEASPTAHLTPGERGVEASPTAHLTPRERGVEASLQAHLTPGKSGVEASSPAHLTPAACGTETATQALLQQGRAAFALSAPRAQTPEDPFLAPLSPRGRGVGGEGASQPATEDEAWLQARVRELRQQQTPEEHALWQQLRAKRFAGYKFRRQQLLGRFIVDFVCFAQRLIVELDGGQHAEAAEYDSRRDAWLKQQGFRVLRFWNNEWSAQREAVLEAIWQALQQEPPLPNPSPTRGEGLEAADIARPAVVPSAPFWREEETTLSALPGDKTHALASPRDAEEAALSPLSPRGRGAGGEGASARETGAQLLQRILAERRARWEAKQLAKFKEQGKAPPKDWQTKYPEPEPPNDASLIPLPEGWTWATVDQLSVVVRGASPRPAGDPRFFGGSIPWITVGSLTADDSIYLTQVDQYVTDAGREASRFIEPDTLLLTNSGATLGVPKITRIGGCINDGSVALLDADEPLKTYLYWFLSTQTRKLRALNQGAAQPNLNTDIVRRICVPLCSKSEQQRVIAAVSEGTDLVRDLLSSVKSALKQSAAQRKNILKAAFSGQLVPQDPNDEPAGVLLARIRAERAVRDAVKKPRGRKTKEAA